MPSRNPGFCSTRAFHLPTGLPEDWSARRRMIDPWTLSWTRMREPSPMSGPSRNSLPLKVQSTMSTTSSLLGPSLPSYSQAKAALVAPVKA